MVVAIILGVLNHTLLHTLLSVFSKKRPVYSHGVNDINMSLASWSCGL